MAAINVSPHPRPIQVLTPSTSSTVNRPLAPIPGSQMSPTAFTHKEWVIPPRPKPGRKPAGDAPPTKRKAQNREAQRAFRERRAAKVGELEQQLAESERDNQQENESLRARVNAQDDMITSLQQRYRDLDEALARERQQRQQAEVDLSNLKEEMAAQNQAVALPPRRQRTSFMGEQTFTGHDRNASENGVTCGRCSSSTRCQCIEEAFEMAGIAVDGEDNANSKRTHSPHNEANHKRIRSESHNNAYDGNEIDFTTQYASQQQQLPDRSTKEAAYEPGPMELESCGYCNDGKDCLCEAISKEIARQPAPEPSASNFENGSDEAPTTSTCNNNPGTCAQCRSDPMSTLFCRTLAATRAKPDSKSGQQASQALPQAAPPGPTLTCADAFTTLSRHHAYSQASSELGSWVTQLTAVPGSAKTAGMTAFEIEAASVMSVLKFFDNRFGQAGSNAAINGGDEK